jgi:hypothetical protein
MGLKADDVNAGPLSKLSDFASSFSRLLYLLRVRLQSQGKESEKQPNHPAKHI